MMLTRQQQKVLDAIPTTGCTSYWLSIQLRMSARTLRNVIRQLQYRSLVKCDRNVWEKEQT